MVLKHKVAFFAFASMLAADQIVKQWVVSNIPYPPRRTDEVELIPQLFALTHAKNDGAAFSMMENFPYRMHAFAIFTVVAVVGLLWAMTQLRNDDKLQSSAIGLILSGALGNAIDRLRFQQVTDMFKLYGGWDSARSWLVSHFGTYVWPIFNVADVAILAGVGLFGLSYLFERDEVTGDVGRAPSPL